MSRCEHNEYPSLRIVTSLVLATAFSSTALPAAGQQPPPASFESPAPQTPALKENARPVKEANGEEADRARGAGAASPGSAGRNKAVSPADAKQMPVRPELKEQRRPEVRRSLPAVQDKQPASGRPQFLRVVPGRGKPGSRVRFEGRHFGPDRGDRSLHISDGPEGSLTMEIHRWSDDEIVATVPDTVPGRHNVRMISEGGGPALTSIHLEVLEGTDSPFTEGGAPEGLEPKATRRLRQPGGFAGPGGGLVGSCDGPDLAAFLTLKEAERKPDGSYRLRFDFGLRNVGSADFVSGRGQQHIVLLNGSRTVVGPVEFSPPGPVHSGVSHTYRGFRGATFDWHGGEFATDVVARIGYDPDIFMDGNPDNDDCNMSNNEARMTAEQIAEAMSGAE